jgi:hypothetical protein
MLKSFFAKPAVWFAAFIALSAVLLLCELSFFPGEGEMTIYGIIFAGAAGVSAVLAAKGKTAMSLVIPLYSLIAVYGADLWLTVITFDPANAQSLQITTDALHNWQINIISPFYSVPCLICYAAAAAVFPAGRLGRKRK